MAKFVAYRDFFKWNKQLMEDDYNDGQLYTLKMTNKTEGGVESTMTAKIGEASTDATKPGHKLAIEEKLKGHNKELGGFSFEGKLKNSGDVEGEMTFNQLNSIEGLEKLNLVWKQAANTSAGLKKQEFGFSFDNDDVKTKLLVTPDLSMYNELTVRTPYLNLMSLKKSNLKDPFGDTTGELGVAGHYEKATQWGALLKYEYKKSFKPTQNTLYFNHENNGNAAGCELTYNYADKTFNSKLGVKLAQDDHLWKFRLHGDGLMRAALQWQMHKACKTTLTSQINLKDVPAGKVSGIPLGINFEVKY